MRACLAVALTLVPFTTALGQHTLAEARWLEGCWERAMRNGRMVERWLPAANGVMLGTSQIVTDSSLRESEQLRLVQAEGGIAYDAHPATQSRTLFPASLVSAGALVFENPAHDYPQRITYARRGADSVIVTIEGDRAGRRGPVTFAFRKAECGRVTLSPGALAREELAAHYRDLADGERAAFAARYAWFADRAAPGYVRVTWSAPGSVVNAQDAAAMRQLGTALQASVAPLAPRDLRFDLTLERVLARGDTAEALVTASHRYSFADAQGRFGAAGATHERGGTQRWIDRWVKQEGAWRLHRTDLISDVGTLDGTVTVRDGRPIR